MIKRFSEALKNKSGFRAEWWLASAITLIIFYFHFHFWLNVGGFWRDEVNSISIANSHSLAGMSHDSFPILMPLLLHGWLALGIEKNDLILRLFGLLMGLSIPVALWFFAGKIRQRPPLISLVLFAMSGYLIVFGDSIRAYGLGCLLIIFSVGVACLYLQRPTWIRALWLALFSILSVQTLYHNAILVAAICIGSWAVCWRRKSWREASRILLAGALAAISLLPYVYHLIFISHNSAIAATGASASRLKSVFEDAMGFPTEQYVFVWIAVILILIFFAIERNFKRERLLQPPTFENDLSLFTATTVPVAFIAYWFFLRSAPFASQIWYVLPLLALTAVCVDIAWPDLQKKSRAVFFGLVAATALIAIPKIKSQTDFHMTNADIWGRELSNAASPKDYIIVLPWYCGISFGHYYTGSSPWNTVPPISDHTIHRYDLLKAQLQNTNAIVPIIKKINDTLQSGHRVWILAQSGFMGIPEPGTLAPKSLPPAPTFAGWSEFPYRLVWASQIGHYLGDHSIEFSRVQNPSAKIPAVENLELFMADGWRKPVVHSIKIQP